MTAPLMPKATAVWLVDNTALTFDQIAAFCGLHPLEVKGIADGDVAMGIKGQDPVTAGQITREEIKRGEEDTSYELKILESKHDLPEPKKGRKGPRYTPLSRRQERPDAIAWLVRYHPELTDGQIGKLVGTTKPTIQSIRDRSHWNMSNINPVDPVTLGLSTQIELDAAVQKAGRRLEREAKKAGKSVEDLGKLAPATQALADAAAGITPADEGDFGQVPDPSASDAPNTSDAHDSERPDADSVFSSLGGSTVAPDEEDDTHQG